MDRILVVDDSPVVCRVLAAWLRDAGYAVSTASTAAEGLRAVAADKPSLVMLDLVLPDGNGADVCAHLKRDEATARIPVVVMTAAASSENRIRCLDLGAEDFLGKPVIREELIARVRSSLRSKHLSDRLLMSYFEIDRLGHFAETFTTQSITDWSALQVANAMARHLLGQTPGLPGHPRAAWAGQRLRTRFLGSVWYWQHDAWVQENTQFTVARLEELLDPFACGEGEYLCAQPPTADLCDLLQLPAGLAPSNLVGLWHADNAVLALGYPWEIGAYELPLLRSLIRHWAVFERIRYEARLSEQAFFTTMEALALAAEFHDRETAGHIRRVSAYSRLLAETLSCAPRFVKWVATSAPMHDVGKITIPTALLQKPAPLDDEERDVVRRHTVNGAALLGDLPPLVTARSIALHHHESYDGSGYPEGLVGDAIPLEARIVKVADVYDALRTKRPYKEAFTHEEALRVFREGDDRVMPAHFDPTLREAFLDLHREMEHIYASIRSSAPDEAHQRDS